MADTVVVHHHTRKKRKRFNSSNKKFPVGDIVEVRSFEQGFIGSWHPGKIIRCKSGSRVVKYDHLLNDDNGETYAESIKVSGLIDGITNDLKSLDQCRIRPQPPVGKLVENDLHYGLCVDSYLRDAWWEGVVFDHDDGSKCREIFFPDLGDKEMVELKNLRITQDWDEVTEEWAIRGKWLFLELIEKYALENLIPVSTRQIWYDMRVRTDFDELGDWWDIGNAELQERLIVKVIDEYLRLSAEHFLSAYDFSETKLVLVSEANAASAHDVVPLIDDDVQDDFMTVNDTRQPMVLSIGPSSTNLDPVVESKLSIISKRVPTSKKGRSRMKDLKPQFCPESVDDYAEKKTFDVMKKFTQHVLYLGWKIENITHGSHNVRFRYISPTPSEKPFYSLREVAKFLKNKGDNSAEMAEDSGRAMATTPSSPISGEGKYPYPALLDKSERSVVPSMERNREDKGECDHQSVTPKYCPESVCKYLEYCNDKGPNNRNVFANIVRGHLIATGWRIWLQKVLKGSKERRYAPPGSKKVYCSLKAACEAIVNGSVTEIRDPSTSNATEGAPCNEGHKDLPGNQQVLSTRSQDLKKHTVLVIKKQDMKKNGRYTRSLSCQFKHENGVLEVADDGITNGLNNEQSLLISKSSSKKRKALNKVKSCSDGHNSTRMLRSSKRVRQTGPQTSSQVPRTVLSWLIENNAVVPRSKVYYYKGNSRDPLAVGRITSEGIKCNCCEKLFTLSSFQAHAAGINTRPPAENLFLDNGESLASCQAKLMRDKMRSFSSDPVEEAKGPRDDSWNDHICSICHYGGDLILCDQCPSSFHSKCLNFEVVPEGDWFCPSCCCGVCGNSHFAMNTELLTDANILCCHQCERKYHACCKKDRDVSPGEDWFCCRSCEKIHWGLQQLLDKPILVGHDNLTWTLVKPMQYQEANCEGCDLIAMAENYSKISVALEVMHECFEPVKEPRTKRDLVEDVLFCRGSNLNRLNFKGFYTVLLERNDELITVALLRVYGDTVAEIPLIGTRFQHRRLGMCRILMNEIEKNLLNLGVQKLVLPAAASVINTWINSFGFSRITESDRSEFLGYTFLDFQDTVMCRKLLRKLPPLPYSSRDMSGIRHQTRRTIEGSNIIINNEGSSNMSEVFQEDQREGSETVDQGAQVNATEDKPDGTDNNLDAPSTTNPDAPSTTNPDAPSTTNPDTPLTTVTAIVSSNQENDQPCNPLKMECKKIERLKSDGNLQCYKRKKASEPRPPVPQTSFSKVEVSCR